MGDKKTGFFVEGTWENSYLDITWGSAVQLAGPSLEAAVGRGTLTVQAMADFSLTCTVGVFLTSHSLTKCAIKQLRQSKAEVTASGLALELLRTGAAAARSQIRANEIQGSIDTLQTRLDRAIASAERSSLQLTVMGAAAGSNEATLNSLRASGNDAGLIGVGNNSAVAEEGASGSNSRMSGKRTQLNASDLGAFGSKIGSSARNNQVAGLSNAPSVMTSNV